MVKGFLDAIEKKECLMSLKKFADADLYTNKSGRQRRGRRKEFTDRVSLDINGRTIVSCRISLQGTK